MKILVSILLLFGTLSAPGADNYIIPGARQEGTQTAVVAAAVLSGTTGYGNPVMVQKVMLTGSTGAALTESLTLSTLTSGTTSVATGAKVASLAFSSNFAGSVIATGTMTFAGAADAGYVVPVANGELIPALSIVVTSGTARLSVSR